MTRVGITGYKGKIGSELCLLGGIPLDCDITIQSSIEKAIQDVKPDVIVHCAGISSVDECAKDWKRTFEVNVMGSSKVLSAFGKPFFFLSSDHVFDGKKGNYSEKDKVSNLSTQSFYGLSKFGAEASMKALGGKIIRLSTVFGPEIIDKDITSIPTFIYRSYGYVKHIVLGIWYAAQHHQDMPNVLNISGTEIMSMYEFMLTFVNVFELDSSSVNPRYIQDSSFVSRPFKGGLNVKLARKLGVPLFSAYEGLVQLKDDCSY